MKTIFAMFAAVFFSLPAVGETIASPARPTLKCGTQFTRGIYMNYAVATNDPLILAMIAAVQDPASNPALYERMGKPIGVTTSHIIDARMQLDYDRIQDMEEVAARFRADAELASRFQQVYLNNAFWGFITQVPATQVVREYYNAALNHYYMASVPAEIEWLDAGGGGGGWVRTGQAWNTLEVGIPGRFQPEYSHVYMFYGTPGIGPNSHYFTASPEECGYLRRTVGWTYVAMPFGAKRPVNGACPADAPAGLMMLYNNRAAQNDSNHRYTTNSTIYAQMQAQGWTGYGVQLCVKEVIGPY